MGWQNNTFDLLIVNAGGGFSGVFIYSPAAGTGNLIASFAGVAGTDPYGNPYPVGLAVYDQDGDIINLQDGEILMSTMLGLLRQITPTADLMYSPAAAAGTLSVAIASQAGVDAFGNTFLQGLTATAGQLSGQVISASAFEGLNIRLDEHGIFLYQAPATRALTVASVLTGTSTPYFAGHNAAAGGAGTTLVVTMTNPIATGDFIYVSGDAANAGPQVTQVTDNKGNAYTKQANSSSGIPVSIWTAPGSAGLTVSDTVTLTYATSAGAKAAIVCGIPNLQASPVDNVPTPTTGTSTSPSITSGTLAQPVEVVLATLGSGNAGGAPAWAGGWNLLDTEHRGASSDQYISVAYQVVSSTAPVTASATIVSAIWDMCLASFVISASAGPPTVIELAAPAVITAPPLPYVIGGNTAAAGGSTVVITLGAGVSTTAGDVILAAGCGDGTDLPQSVTDSKSNPYTLVESTNSNIFAATYQAGASGTPTVALAPGDTITFTYTGTTGNKAVSATGIPNLPASSLDFPACALTGGVSNAPNTDVFGLAESTEVSIVTLAAANGAGGTVTWTDGATATLDQRHAGTGPWLTTAYQFVSILPQLHLAATIGASVNWTLANANFKEV